MFKCEGVRGRAGGRKGRKEGTRGGREQEQDVLVTKENRGNTQTDTTLETDFKILTKSLGTQILYFTLSTPDPVISLSQPRILDFILSTPHPVFHSLNPKSCISLSQQPGLTQASLIRWQWSRASCLVASR